MKAIGIEKMAVYPGTLKLSMEELAKERGDDPNYVLNDLLVGSRSEVPLWEDCVTMAVNSANIMLAEEDKQDIGLFIVATETGLDQGKAISTWAHRYLGLAEDCRVLEVKVACHAGAAALNLAQGWIASGLNGNRKVLLINVDISHNMIEKGKMEYSLGAGAVSLLLSNNPLIAEIELGMSGIHTHEVTDVIRPMPWKEVAFDVEASLFSYMDALDSCYTRYEEKVASDVSAEYFDHHVYHVPFPAMAREAHKQLLEIQGSFDKPKAAKSFKQKVLPSLQYSREIGATYAGSIFLCLFSLVANAKEIKSGDRVGVYSYGSGSCAEFFSLIIAKNAQTEITKSKEKLECFLKNRTTISVSEYETLENERTRFLQSGSKDFRPQFSSFWFTENYLEKKLLVLSQLDEHRRVYDFS